MITIKECVPPKKLPGLSSFLVSFPYNESIIDVVKYCGNGLYHKKEQQWEIPVTSLQRVLDSLTYLDDIELFLADGHKEEHSEEITKEEIDSFKIHPYKHQIEAINYGLNKDKWLLGDEMGAGKTSEAICLAEVLHKRGLISHCLVICGVNAVKKNWQREIEKFSNETSIILGEKISPKTGKSTYLKVSDRAEQLKNPIDEFFIITNVETLRSDIVVEAFKKSKNKIDMIIVDEIHRISTKSSLQGANLIKLDSKYKLGISGTLLTNSPISCYVPLSWTENDKSTQTCFKSFFCKFGGFKNSQIIGYKNLEVLKEELSACMLRRKKEELVDLPSKTVTVELIEMSDEHKKFYDTIKSGVKEEINKAVDKVRISTKNLLALTTRLRQATSCPSLLTTQPIESSKIERCVELVEDLMAQGEKVVVMSFFKEPIYILAGKLKQYRPLINTGDISQEDVDKNAVKFENDPDARIFLGTMAKCGTGLNLNSASYMICLDEAWTSAQNNQCHDRVHRLNNTRPAFITVLVCKDTIDERVHYISQYKQDLSDWVVDGEENEISMQLRNEMENILLDL